MSDDSGNGYLGFVDEEIAQWISEESEPWDPGWIGDESNSSVRARLWASGPVKNPDAALNIITITARCEVWATVGPAYRLVAHTHATSTIEIRCDLDSGMCWTIPDPPQQKSDKKTTEDLLFGLEKVSAQAVALALPFAAYGLGAGVKGTFKHAFASIGHLYLEGSEDAEKAIPDPCSWTVKLAKRIKGSNDPWSFEDVTQPTFASPVNLAE